MVVLRCSSLAKPISASRGEVPQGLARESRRPKPPATYWLELDGIFIIITIVLQLIIIIITIVLQIIINNH